MDHTSVTSGYIMPGETAEETAVREVKEELGLDLEEMTYAGTVWFEKGDMLMHGYVGYAKKQELVLSEEIDSAEWVPYQELQKRCIRTDREMHFMWCIGSFYKSEDLKKFDSINSFDIPLDFSGIFILPG